jgi:hypothetical protein
LPRKITLKGGARADHAITNAIDAHVQGEQQGKDDDDGSAEALVPAG